MSCPGRPCAFLSTIRLSKRSSPRVATRDRSGPIQLEVAIACRLAVKMSAKNKGTTDESIGRPGPWQEGRYQKSGQSLDTSVAPEQPLDSKNPVKAPAEPKVVPGPISTPVHLDEYTVVGGEHQSGDEKPKRS